MSKKSYQGTKAVAKAERKSGWDLLRIPMFGRDLPLYWTWILLGALVLVMHLMIKLEIKSATFELLDAFGEEGDGKFRNSGYTLGGTLESTDLEIVPYESQAGDRPVTVGRVVVETPGPIWLLRASMPSFSPKASGTLGKLQKAAEKLGGEDDRPNQYPPTDELRIRFEDVDFGDFGLAYLMPEIDWVGGTSGALFEAAGCSNDWWWTRDEVRGRFGAPDADGQIDIELKVIGPDRLSNTITFGHGGNSTLTIHREFIVPGEADDFLDSDPEEWRTTKIRWTVADSGFVKARNAWCAREAQISETLFVDRHVAAVRRTVQAIGFDPTQALLDAYRVYAQNGGTLVWETNLAPGTALEDSTGHGDEAALYAMNARLTVPGRASVAYVGTLIEPRDFPEGDVASVVAVLRREGTLPVAGAVAAPAVAATDVAAETVAPAPLVAETPVAAEPAAIAAGVPEEAAPPEIQRGPIAPKDLDQHVGHTVRLTLANGRRYAGVIERVDARSVSIKVGVGGGSASLSFVRDTIAAIEALGW